MEMIIILITLLPAIFLFLIIWFIKSDLSWIKKQMHETHKLLEEHLKEK